MIFVTFPGRFDFVFYPYFYLMTFLTVVYSSSVSEQYRAVLNAENI